MTKITALSLAALISATTFIGCNSHTEYPSEELSSSVAVYSFSLQADTKVLSGLDSVFFSIDLEKGRIFNATPLPYGTATNKLVVDIKLVEAVSAVKLTATRAGLPDTTYNYGTNPTDSMDFSNGPVKMEVVSANGLNTRTYTINVNVHKEKADSLSWAESARRELPSALDKPAKQKTVANDNGYYCLSRTGNSWSLATSDSPSGNWALSTPQLSADADINSFAAAGEKLYILDKGSLMTSSDGKTWTATGRNFASLYGAYGDKILGAVNTSGSWKVAEYPGDAEYTMPEGMPVSNTSQLIPLDFEMTDSRQVMMMGGIKADGSRTSNVWAFDGREWACLTNRAINKQLSDITIIPFYTFRRVNINTTRKYVCIMALGGTDGKDINRTVYTSVDYGMTWVEGGDQIQLPTYIPTVYGAQAFVSESVLTDSRSSQWQYYGSSRATKPITEWECPYIYLFGGYEANGDLSANIWRGTINMLTFKPVQ